MPIYYTNEHTENSQENNQNLYQPYDHSYQQRQQQSQPWFTHTVQIDVLDPSTFNTVEQLPQELSQYIQQNDYQYIVQRTRELSQRETTSGDQHKNKWSSQTRIQVAVTIIWIIAVLIGISMIIVSIVAIALRSILGLIALLPIGSAKQIFYMEGWLLVLTGTFMIVAPSLSIEMFGVPQEHIGLASYFLQQFSVMCLLMGYVGVRSHPTVPTTTLQACLIADFLYIIMFIPMINEYGAWTAASIFSVAITAFLAVVRIIYLSRQKVKQQ